MRRGAWKREARETEVGGGVEGVGPRVERSVALSGWFKGSREVNAKPVKAEGLASILSWLVISVFNRNKVD